MINFISTKATPDLNNTDHFCVYLSETRGKANYYLRYSCVRWFDFMVFNTTFNNIAVISWRSHLLVEETGVPEENLSKVTDKLDHMLHRVHLAMNEFELTTLVVVGTDSFNR